MPLILGANSVSGYTVKNSLRFNSGSSDYLNRTPASASNRKTYTISTWLKISKIGSEFDILEAASDSSNRTYLSVGTFNTYELSFVYRTGGTNTAIISSSNLLRDVSAWYHIVCAVDTTQATANNRVRLYINGSEVTYATQTMPSQNTDMYINNNIAHHISRAIHASERYFDGYMSDYYFIDGQQLTPSSFGETDTLTGIWIPKAYTGTYGTNGFYLKFANSASLGTDSSGNGNNFTVNNLTSVDQTTDTPSNNFATLNPLNQQTSNTFVLKEGNLAISSSTASGAKNHGSSTIGVSSGKWYCEFKVDSGSYFVTGVSYDPSELARNNQDCGYYSSGWGYYQGTGGVRNNDSSTSYGNTLTTGDILGIALDLDNSKLYFSKNGTWQNSGVPTSGATGTGAVSITSGQTYFFVTGDADGTTATLVSANFGNPPYSANAYTDGAGYGNFSYSVPSGYYSLCTKNLANYG